jgi:hypothetical protein
MEGFGAAPPIICLPACRVSQYAQPWCLEVAILATEPMLAIGIASAN